MFVYIVRHAWAEDQGPQWPQDGLRPLTREGIERFKKVASKLSKRGMTLEVIATSPLVRCRQTAEILAKEMGQPDVVEFAALAPGSDIRALLAWTAQQSAEHVAWVGHAPDVGRLVAELTGASGGGFDFAKGAAAAVEFEGPPALGAGSLRWFVTAKMLGC